MLEIVPAHPRHMAELAMRLRAGDRGEIVTMGLDVDTALSVTWRESMMTHAATVDGRLAAVWGVGGAALGGCGRPWLLTTPAFELLKFQAVRHGRMEIRRWLEVYHRLENYVLAEYRAACRLLEVLGFNLDAPVPLPTGGSVRLFWMERA